MSRLGVFLVCALALSACSGTTTSDTTQPLAPTSVAPLESTTSSSTSTSVVSSSTTTVVAGDWAEQPVVVWDRYVLGWWDGGSWVPMAEDTVVPVSGGEDYQIASLGGSGLVTGGEQIVVCDFSVPSPGIELDDTGSLTFSLGNDDFGEISGVAVSAPWSVSPRPASVTGSTLELAAIARQLLAERGFPTDDIYIVQVVESDLDGDGSSETIAIAEDTKLSNATSGVYSIVFATGPSLSGPAVLDESILPPDTSGYPLSFRVSAIADLNGDDQMEVVVQGSAWESWWSRVFEMVGSRFEARISGGCGV